MKRFSPLPLILAAVLLLGVAAVVAVQVYRSRGEDKSHVVDRERARLHQLEIKRVGPETLTVTEQAEWEALMRRVGEHAADESTR